jgi:hypothetical protein
LTSLFQNSGFEVTNREATFPIDLFLLMGDNYVGNDELGRACHAKRKAFEFALNRSGRGELRRKLYESLIQLDIGREIVIYGEKA